MNHSKLTLWWAHIHCDGAFKILPVCVNFQSRFYLGCISYSLCTFQHISIPYLVFWDREVPQRQRYLIFWPRYFIPFTCSQNVVKMTPPREFTLASCVEPTYTGKRKQSEYRPERKWGRTGYSQNRKQRQNLYHCIRPSWMESAGLDGDINRPSIG